MPIWATLPSSSSARRTLYTCCISVKNNASTSVSYTHLDVYKRQLLPFFGFLLDYNGIFSRFIFGSPSGRAVSYTHLDVYKRQVEQDSVHGFWVALTGFEDCFIGAKSTHTGSPPFLRVAAARQALSLIHI